MTTIFNLPLQIYTATWNKFLKEQRISTENQNKLLKQDRQLLRVLGTNMGSETETAWIHSYASSVWLDETQ